MLVKIALAPGDTVIEGTLIIIIVEDKGQSLSTPELDGGQEAELVPGDIVGCGDQENALSLAIRPGGSALWQFNVPLGEGWNPSPSGEAFRMLAVHWLNV